MVRAGRWRRGPCPADNRAPPGAHAVLAARAAGCGRPAGEDALEVEVAERDGDVRHLGVIAKTPASLSDLLHVRA